MRPGREFWMASIARLLAVYRGRLTSKRDRAAPDTNPGRPVPEDFSRSENYGCSAARERMAEVMSPCWGTEAISSVSAKPMPGMNLPASSRGAATSL